MTATFFPCCELDGCQDELSATSHQNKKEQSGTCSPFSTCATCSGFVVIARGLELNKPLANKIQYQEINISSIFPSFAPSFWQPPRLS